MQEFSNAIEDYDQLINLEPENLDHIADRGLTYHMSGNHDKALNDFDTVIEKEPDNPYWFSCRAFIKDYIKDFEGSYRSCCRSFINKCYSDFVSADDSGIDEIIFEVAGGSFSFCAGVGQISSSVADIRTRMSSLVTLKTM